MASTENASRILRNSASGHALGNWLRFATALVALCCSSLAISAQSGSAPVGSQKVSISDDDFASLAQHIKTLSDPTFRAFLRIRILSWLPDGGDKLRLQNAFLVGRDGLADIQSHQDQMWGPTAARMRESIIASLTRWSPTEASALGAKYQIEGDTQTNARTVKDFTGALARLNDPAVKDQALANASKAILSGDIPPPILLGELLRLDQNNSPQLAEILSVTLTLEEGHTGAFPLQYLNFFQHVYLKNTIPGQLQVRFLNAGVKATRLSPLVFEDAMTRGPAVQLLTGVMPKIEKLAPSLYPEAAGRLQQLSSFANGKLKDKQAAEIRISNSDRPLEQIIAEATDTVDQVYKGELLERAALLARKQGKAHQAVDLMISRDVVSADEDCNKYSATDEFLSEIVGTALKGADMETAEYAATHMRCPVEQANAWRSIAVHYYEEQNVVRGQQSLGAALKSLNSAEDGLRKARVSLALASATLSFEPANSNDAFRRAVDTLNNLPRADKDDNKDFYGSLLPLAEDVIRTFRTLAKHDPGAARSLSVEIRLVELRASATAGIASDLL